MVQPEMAVAITDELPQQLTAIEARELTDKIKIAIDDAWHWIKQAYLSRAWLALDYASWDDYCTSEFGTSRLRLPREERQEVVSSMREIGMSFPAIASATGMSVGSVHQAFKNESLVATDAVLDAEIVDVEAEKPEAAPLATPRPEPRVTGTDGKSYSPRRSPTRTYSAEVSDPICAPVVLRDHVVKEISEWGFAGSDLVAGLSPDERNYMIKVLVKLEDELRTSPITVKQED